MRDLTARLRDIVKRDHGGGTADASGAAAPARELTYVPDPERVTLGLAQAARALGGVPLGDDEAPCVVVDRVWEPHDRHGRRLVEQYAIAADAPLTLFDPRVGTTPDWARRIVFFDLETTGLSGGAGTLPFLA